MIYISICSNFNNNINIYFKNSDEKFTLNGSGSELSQVFLNILNNAKDILLEKKIDNKVVNIEISKENNLAIVKIYDNAGGIPSEIKEKIFDPYFTTKHKSQGTGIGLFMSKKIITQHFDGSIEIKNREINIDNKKYFGAEFSIKIKFIT